MLQCVLQCVLQRSLPTPLSLSHSPIHHRELALEFVALLFKTLQIQHMVLLSGARRRLHQPLWVWVRAHALCLVLTPLASPGVLQSVAECCIVLQ